MTNRRILSIDMLRGLGIMIIVVIHRIHYHWTGMRNTEILKEHFNGPWGPVIVFTIALFTMAGIFYFLSGLVNAYSLYRRVDSGKNTAIKAMLGGLAGGLWIAVMNYVQRVFFMNGFLHLEPGADERFPAGLLTELIRNPKQTGFEWTQVTDPGTLLLIGLVIVSVSLLLGWMLSKPSEFNKKKIYAIFIILGSVALLFSPLSKFYLRPVYENLMNNGSYFIAACVGSVCQEFGLLPYLGYGFFGAVIGIGIASNEKWEKLNKTGTLMALSLLLAGLAFMLLFHREDPFGRGCIGTGICLVELALFIFVQLRLYKFVDLVPEEKYIKRQKHTTGMRRFGMLALTVYILEPVVAEIFRKLCDVLFGTGWNDHLPHVLLFGVFLLILWYFILKAWEKAGFAGSLEWLTGVILLRLAGKRTGKTNYNSLDR